MNAILKFHETGHFAVVKIGEAFCAAMDRVGFETAYRQFLGELKNWFDHSPEYAGKSARIAEQADILEDAVIYAAQGRDFDSVPDISVRDRIFGEIFGPAGKRLVEQKQADADADVAEYMAETGITDESEARRQLVGDMTAGMAFFVENHEAITREADVMGQIEDVIGPVDWRDMGDEDEDIQQAK